MFTKGTLRNINLYAWLIAAISTFLILPTYMSVSSIKSTACCSCLTVEHWLPTTRFMCKPTHWSGIGLLFSPLQDSTATPASRSQSLSFFKALCLHSSVIQHFFPPWIFLQSLKSKAAVLLIQFPSFAHHPSHRSDLFVLLWKVSNFPFSSHSPTMCLFSSQQQQHFLHLASSRPNAGFRGRYPGVPPATLPGWLRISVSTSLACLRLLSRSRRRRRRRLSLGPPPLRSWGPWCLPLRSCRLNCQSLWMSLTSRGGWLSMGGWDTHIHTNTHRDTSTRRG